MQTGDAKERALAKHSISVLGKQLLIFRVDAPRTTVVRIQNVNPKCYGSVKSICKSYGKIKIIKPRYSDVVDVHFWIGDWPNMLNILNRYNIYIFKKSLCVLLNNVLIILMHAYTV